MKAKHEISLITPFKYPLLCLEVKMPDGETEQLYIDVDGQIHEYFFSKGSIRPRVLLMRLCSILASQGLRVIAFGSYIGSAAPSNIIRQGCIFKRTKVDRMDARKLFIGGEGEEEKSLRKKFRTPKYKKNW